MPPKIELLKSRDFGEIVTDTCVFIRENFKPLITCFFVFCGFFIVASAVLGVIQATKMIGVINETAYTASPTRMFSTRSSLDRIFNIEYFLSIFFLMLNFVAMPVTIYSFIALYREKGNIAPTPDEVWGYFKYYFFRIFGSFIVLIFVLSFGFVLCLFPGIYLYPIMALVFPIIIFENASFGYAFNKSFRLIKNNWWQTFGALFVIGIIVYCAMMIILVPTTIMNFGSLILHPKNGMHMSITTTVISAVLQSLCHVFYVVPLITVALCYFNLSERFENTGLLGRIDQLGNTGPADNLPTEEY